MFKKLLLLFIIYYLTSYCCIYVSIVTFELTEQFNPEYRCVDMTGTEYAHVYVHVYNHDLFLNPFRQYGNTYRIYNTTEEIKKVCPNYGQLYVPVLDVFIPTNK